MTIRLYSFAASPDCLRLWAGSFGKTAVPDVANWILDGQAAVPRTLRAMSSVRPNNLLADPKLSRAFSGVYEFTPVAAGLHRVRVTIGGETIEQSLSTIPEVVPAELGASFNLLLVSCFHQSED